MDLGTKILVGMLAVCFTLFIAMEVFLAVDPYGGFDLVALQAKIFGFHSPPEDPWGLALSLALNETRVKYIATTVLNETNTSQIEVFKHDPRALIRYLRGWIERHIKYRGYSDRWIQSPEEMFKHGYGKCVDYAEIFIATLMYFNYSPLFLVDQGNHLACAVKIGNDILFFDEWYATYLTYWVKHQPMYWWGTVRGNKYIEIVKMGNVWKANIIGADEILKVLRNG